MESSFGPRQRGKLFAKCLSSNPVNAGFFNGLMVGKRFDSVWSTVKFALDLFQEYLFPVCTVIVQKEGCYVEERSICSGEGSSGVEVGLCCN